MFVLVAPPPPLPAPVVVGRSVRGRPIAVRRIGEPSAARKALVIGAIHGDEGAGRAIVRALADAGTAPAGTELWLVSTVNPDGAARRMCTNARGVDLNRNFPRAWRAGAPGGDHGGPRPLSEPETRAVRRLILRIRPRVTIWFHQPWGQLLAPCRGPAPLQRRYAAVSGLQPKRCRGSDLPGTATRWQMHAAAVDGVRRRAARGPAAGGGSGAPRPRRARRHGALILQWPPASTQPARRRTRGDDH